MNCSPWAKLEARHNELPLDFVGIGKLKVGTTLVAVGKPAFLS
ncbi:hypothetical protein ES703_46417 [subsurface metagenome]